MYRQVKFWGNPEMDQHSIRGSIHTSIWTVDGPLRCKTGIALLPCDTFSKEIQWLVNYYQNLLRQALVHIHVLSSSQEKTISVHIQWRIQTGGGLVLVYLLCQLFFLQSFSLKIRGGGGEAGPLGPSPRSATDIYQADSVQISELLPPDFKHSFLHKNTDYQMLH